MATIQFRNVSKHFGDVVALKDLELTIHDREFLVLLGPSGCGKTTALRILAGLENATSGQIVVDDQDVTQSPAGDRDLAMVFQNYALYPHMTVFENVSFSLRIKRVPKPEIRRRVLEVAEMLGLQTLLDRRPRELSGGQRQRVALGRAVIRRPRAFLMDEPLSNLDAKLRTSTRSELTRLHRELAGTFVYVTHDQTEAMSMATRIAVMADGRLQQLGTPAEIYDRPATTFVAQFIGTPPMNLIPAKLSRRGSQLVGQEAGIEVALPELTAPFGGAVLIGVRPEDLRLDQNDVDDCGTISALVTSVEMLGNEVVVLFDVGATSGAMRGPRSLRVQAGERVTLTCSQDALHIYAMESGARLETVSRMHSESLVPLIAG